MQVNYKVCQSYCHIVNSSDSIGTDGLGTCVGVIVVSKDKKVFCGHMDCAYSGLRENQTIVLEKAQKVLQTTIPWTGDQVIAVYYASASGRAGDPTSKWMIQAIDSKFSGKIKTTPVQLNKGNTGIAWTGNKEEYSNSTLEGKKTIGKPYNPEQPGIHGQFAILK